MNIKREEKIYLDLLSDNTYKVTDRDGKVLLGADDDYFIYFKNVNFKPNGIIDGRYLGDDPAPIIDNHCKSVSFEKGKGFVVAGEVVKTARMVAVNNKKDTLIIIQM